MLLRSIAFYKIFGLPLLAYGGLLALILILAAAFIGSSILAGKNKFSIKNHVWLARAAIAVALLHGALAFLAFINI